MNEEMHENQDSSQQQGESASAAERPAYPGSGLGAESSHRSAEGGYPGLGEQPGANSPWQAQQPAEHAWWSGAGTPQGSGGYPAMGQGYQGSNYGGTAAMPTLRGRSKPRRSFSGIVAIALVAGIVGGGVGVGGGYLLADHSGPTTTLTASAPPANSVSAKAGSVQFAAKTASKSTVDIKVQGGQTADEGTGIILSGDGYVLTNNHVITAAAQNGQIQVTLPDGKKSAANIVGTAPSYDLAVIKVSGAKNLAPAKLGQSSSVAVGQPVAAIGTPFGLADTVTSGIVSALNRTVTVQAQNGQTVVYSGLQTDAPINPGNSGGPLVNMDGQVIGVNSAINSGGSSSGGGQAGSIGLGFSIPIDTARRVANDLMQNKYTNKPVLGVVGSVASGSGNGAKIGGVQSGSAAAKAGIKKGDVITKVDKTPLSSYADLMAQILTYSPGQQVTLTLKSAGGGTHTVQVKLGSKKDVAQTTVTRQQQNPFGGQGGSGGLGGLGGFGGH
ncbi:MAG: S1C family serine protease [Sciscionella sp.]